MVRYNRYNSRKISPKKSLLQTSALKGKRWPKDEWHLHCPHQPVSGLLLGSY